MTPIRVVECITRLIVGGAQETTLLTAALLDRSRFTCEVISGPQTGSEGELFTEAAARGVTVHLEPTLVREVHPWKDVRAVANLTAFFRRHRPDIVHTHSSKAGVVGRIAARRAGVPHVVHTVHGWGFHPRQSWAERTLYQAVERWCAPMSDRLIVVAEPNREQGLRLGIGTPGQYRLIRSGIEVEQYRAPAGTRERVRASLGLADGQFVFGSVGRLSPQKAPADLVHAFARVVHEHPEAHLLLVGDGPLRGEVESLIARLGVSGHATLLGLRRDVSDLMSAFDAFVLASRWEGLPRTIPQAMAAGLPVIATRVDGAPDAVRDGETGCLVPPADVGALADGMAQLIADPDRSRTLGRAGRARVHDFSAGRMVVELEALYEELVRRDGVRQA